MLDTYPYDRQRKLRPRTIEKYAADMKAGRFLPTTIITVAYAQGEDGVKRGYLINGQHRLLAVIMADARVVFTIQHVDCEDMREVAYAYAHQDTNLPRNVGDWGAALGLHDRIGMPYSEMHWLYGALGFMEDGFRDRHRNSMPLQRREELVDEFAGSFRAIYDYIEGGQHNLRIQLKRQSILAVALVTVEDATDVFGKEKVGDFWRGVAYDDGLGTYDPRKVAVRHLFEMEKKAAARAKRITPDINARVMAYCWNKWAEGKEIKTVRGIVGNEPIYLMGTRHGNPYAEKAGS